MTTTELAKILGISRVSLSKYMNGRSGVSAETASRIDAAIAEYDFMPNVHARSLIGKQEKVIGFFSSFSFVFDSHSQISSHFSTEFTNYVLIEAEKAGYKVLATLCSQDKLVSEVNKLFSSRMIMGGILFGYTTDAPEVRQLCEKKYPLVLVNQEERCDYPNISMVNMDDEECAYNLVKRLIDLGHRRFLYVYSSIHRLPAIRRTRNIEKAIRDYSGSIDSYHKIDGEFNEDISYRRMDEYLASLSDGDHPTAVIAANDLSAIGCMEALQKAGYRIPDDVSVTGFDDILISSYLRPPLSTFRADFGLLAHHALSEIVSMVENNQEGKRIEIKMEYVERSSVAPASTEK